MKHQISSLKSRFNHASLFAIVASLMLGLGAQAQSEETIRHTVIEGDTLWSLADRYMDNPWSWRDLWEQNNQIENPDMIFPGDVLLITPGSVRMIPNTRMSTGTRGTTGTKVTKLTPKIRRSPSHAITTIEPSVIMPFLDQSIIVEPEVLAKSAYILQGTDDKIILGRNSRFYATGFQPSEARDYMLFSTGRPIKDVATETTYGVEGIHLGRARMIKHEGDVAELEVIEANQDVRPGDRLIPIENPTELPRYFPSRPKSQIEARILAIPKGVNEAGRRDVVIISSGSEQGLEEGNVLEVFSYKGEIRDPITSKMITLPDYKTGTAMVFKTYSGVSYALLMETSAAVKVGDRATSP